MSSAVRLEPARLLISRDFGGLFAPHKDGSLQQLRVGDSGLLENGTRWLARGSRLQSISSNRALWALSDAGPLVTAMTKASLGPETSNLKAPTAGDAQAAQPTRGGSFVGPMPTHHRLAVGVQAALGNDCQIAHVGIGGSLLLPENRRLGCFLVSGDRFSARRHSQLLESSSHILMSADLNLWMQDGQIDDKLPSRQNSAGSA